MTEERELAHMVRSIVMHAESRVDVEGDLEALHDRRMLASVRLAPSPARLPERRRYVLLAVAACVVVLAVATAALLGRGTDRRITPVSEPPGSPASTGTPVTTGSADTTVEPERAFTPIEPSGGVVFIDPDTPLNAATFESRSSVDLSGASRRLVLRVTDSTFAAVDETTGAVDVFGLDGTVLGRTNLPVTRGEGSLRSITVGPEFTLYALYGFERTTIVAFTLDDPTREITSWQGGLCEANCYLVATDTGFREETGKVVPYVDAQGVEIGGPARPLDPAFTTTWSPDSGNIPTRVDISGPNGAPGWAIRVDRVTFNNDLYRSFVRQAYGWFTTAVLLEPVTGDRDSRLDVRLWLVDDGRVVAVDASTVPGLIEVVVTVNGDVLGLVRTATGVDIGLIQPATD